ncbi:PE domain-containing protein [Actinosynnema pretiosum subsp. pretiosum]|uniref:PE domain-containing protein n=1 Tax=Actinosynnema pretiosum subsp. pretiosum TaxID=103721 RepID=A0AA45R3V1_9PSEU|nr:PE domain-containing protein [Actinosynnema pretiosum subsp. pretiosum]
MTMQVEPGKIMELKGRYEAVRDTVQAFLMQEDRNLLGVALAGDDVSTATAPIFEENALVAVDVTSRFLRELTLNIEQLENAARLYGLVEEGNAAAFQVGEGG